MASMAQYPNKIQSNHISDSSEDEGPTQRLKKRTRQISESEGEISKDSEKNDTNSSGSENEISKSRSLNIATRITLQNDSDSDSKDIQMIKNKWQQTRLINKQNKISEKFKSLLKSRKYEDKLGHVNSPDKRMDSNSDSSDEDLSSIEKNKQFQKIKERTSFMPSLCDPDTSDGEDTQTKRKVTKKKERRSTKATSPKPIKMSAKQAMENLHKIKSESNRMLREKEVSLPYHRPKALSLKDIMSRRKPALNAEGKALPVKMNEMQLKEYALLLEQRQKEMMELCKSDTDEDNDNEEASLQTERIEPQPEEYAQNKLPKPDNASCIDVIIENCKPISETVENSTLLDNIKCTDVLISGVNTDVKSVDLQCSETNEPVESDKKVPQTVLADIISDSNSIEKEKNKTIDDNLKINVVEVHSNDSIKASVKSALEADSLEQSKSKHKMESQLFQLQYDSEITKDTGIHEEINKPYVPVNIQDSGNIEGSKKENLVTDLTFSDDDDLDMDYIDKLIENTDIIKETNSSKFVRNHAPLKVRPILTGAPGTVIHLDETEDIASKKLTGIELLKERFSYFARVKTPEELEREKEKKLKPGSLHLRLKQQLEDQIAEQRSLEWAKRLEDEKQQQLELKALRGEEIDEEDDIEKIEAKIKKDKEDNSKENEEETSSSEEEVIEDDVVITDKPRVKDAMIDDEAEESDYDEDNKKTDSDCDDSEEEDNHNNDGPEEGDDKEESEDGDSDDNSSSEDEEITTCKKGRIVRAFEDSDDEIDVNKIVHENETNLKETDDIIDEDKFVSNYVESETYTQDDEIQLAQQYKSEDLFTSQESEKVLNNSKEGDVKEESMNEDKQLGVFSIARTKNSDTESVTLENNTGITDTQPFVGVNLILRTETCLNTITQSILPSQLSTQQSQPIGDDILALCTGKFYDNEFITPPVQNNTESQETTDCESQLSPVKFDEKNNRNTNNLMNEDNLHQNNTINTEKTVIEKAKGLNKNECNNASNTEANKCTEKDNTSTEDSNILKSILDELNNPDFNNQKHNKYFIGNVKDAENTNPLKKKFVIESDEDEVTKINEVGEKQKKKKLKKKKPEKRVLQISDDEEEDVDDEGEDYVSDLEEDNERIVEYDSEENEVEVNIEKPKKKRKVADFFEQEAELTSEDEWVGSGDEDEAGLDRMEREEGDDEKFNQGQLQRELEQIHMRDVLDQDKREVRIIQELLFEDGDLGVGSRQRKFRWKNADGEEETGVINDDITDTQEEEFESEEQWRKQRHEREVFLRQMKNEDEIEANISINRTSIIKANLNSKSMSSVILEASSINIVKTGKPVPIEKKNSKDIPSPKKPFAIFQQNYHGSLLTRGRGALARLAALATPLAVDDDAPKIGSLAPSSRRNFVFAALSQEETKVTKRKADSVNTTPQLVKKIKLEEKQKRYKSSLLDHLKV